MPGLCSLMYLGPFVHLKRLPKSHQLSLRNPQHPGRRAVGELGDKGSTHQQMHEQNILPRDTGRRNAVAMGKRVQFLDRDGKWMCYIKGERIWVLTQAEYRRKASRREWEAEINKREVERESVYSQWKYWWLNGPTADISRRKRRPIFLVNWKEK